MAIYMAVRPHVSGSLFCHFNYKKVTRNPACKDSKSKSLLA